MVNHVLGKLQTGSPRHYREEQLLLVKKCCCGHSQTDDRRECGREPSPAASAWQKLENRPLYHKANHAGVGLQPRDNSLLTGPGYKY